LFPIGPGPAIHAYFGLWDLDSFPAIYRQKACRYGQMLYPIHDQYIGQSLELYGEYSEGEVEVFRQIVQPGDLVIEVGANIGAHTVFLAGQVGPAGRVMAFEPQRLLFHALCANVALNNLTNVRCVLAAVSDRPGTVHVPQFDLTKDNNYGNMRVEDFDFGETVEAMTLDGLDVSGCHFLKIDVEGMEEKVLRGGEGLINRSKPVLYVENDVEEKSDSLIRFIDSLGYEMYWHRPAYYNRDNFLGNPTNVFPNQGSMNMLCVHTSMPHNLVGLPRVVMPT
jgi:FkbM family methyltransferase